VAKETALLIGVGVITAGFFIMKTFSGKSLSKNGLDAIKAHEGWSSVVYKDQAGLPTIGYGHLLKPGEHFAEITRQMGETLLSQDVYFAVNAVNSLVTVDLSQGQFDALVSFVYNVGAGAFENSTLLAKLNAGDYRGAFDEFERWNKVTVNGEKILSYGLVKRRRREQELFLA
jgi:lysozyme